MTHKDKKIITISKIIILKLNKNWHINIQMSLFKLFKITPKKYEIATTQEKIFMYTKNNILNIKLISHNLWMNLIFKIYYF